MLSSVISNGLVPSSTLVTFCVVLAASYWWMNKRREARLNLPPCPWVRLPVVGNFLQMMRMPKRMCQTFYDLSKTKEYSKVFTMYMGPYRTIVLNHIDVVQEALIQRQQDYCDRPVMYSLYLATDGGKDIFGGRYNDIWKFQRRVGQLALRNYASGECLERVVNEALDITFAAIEKDCADGKPFNIKPHLVLLIINVLSGISFNKTYKLEDETMNYFADVTRKSLELINKGLPADFLPWLKYFPKSEREKKTVELIRDYHHFLKQHLDEHIEKRSSGVEDLSDLTDYLLHQQDHSEKEDPTSKGLLTDSHILMTLFDVFGAGIDTLVTSLHYFIAHLMLYPEVEAQMRDEINKVVGTGPVGLSHRSKLPYTEACMRENLRAGTVAVVGFPLTTMCDTKIASYNVPKGTFVVVNFWALHNDPDQWEEPEKFKPERFLDAEGNLGPKIPSFMPFSGGRRVCLGENLAKSTLMMVIPRLYQHFEFSSPLGKNFKLEIEDSVTLAYLPKPYDVIVKRKE